jgi:signal transduction histidine kinase
MICGSSSRRTPATEQRRTFTHVNALSGLVRRRGVDALIVLAALGSVLEVALRHDAKLPQTSRWFALPAVALIVLALLGWRRQGFTAGAALWLLAAGVSVVDGRLVVSTVSIQAAGLAASYLLGNARDPRQAHAGLAVALACAAIVVSNDPNRSGSEFVFIPALFAVAWVAGFVLRQRTAQGEAALERADRLEMEQEEQARHAIAEERARIARELHDVVGHCVSVMTVQASAVRRVLTPEQRQEREALMAVERVGREALAEMRRLVGILRDSLAAPDLAPQPTLRELDVLISHARASGLAVAVSVDGDPLELPASIDLTAYRIVQEGLTNAIRHAQASSAQVHICHRAGGLDIEVSDDGIGVSGNGHGAGHGLLGMSERVDVFGGHLEAGPCAGGGYRLRARLPVPA